MVSPAQPPAADAPLRQSPHFEISVEDNRGQLMLRPSRFFGWLRVDQLELSIPNVKFPLDITGGMAQFQRQRCPLIAATFAVDAAGLSGLVARRAGALAMAGFENVSIELEAGAIELTALARVRERTAELVVRLRITSDGRHLRLELDEAVTLGWVRRPSSLLAHDLLCVLLGAVDAGARSDADAVEGPMVRGLGEIALQPLELFAATVLSPAGWRLPDFEGLRVAQIAITPEQVRLQFSQGAAEQPATAPRIANLQRITAPLLRNDLAGAVAVCRELALERETARESTKHLLDLLSARDGSLREAELIAREALLRWPDFVHSQLCLAAIASARGRSADAIEHFAEAARLADAGGRTSLGLRAALAAARGAVDENPARAIALYEQASKRRPADERVVSALAELYTRSARWPELVRLYRSQVAGAADSRAQANAQLKLGEVLLNRMRDPEGARREIDEATRLDPRSRRAWELRADIAVNTGDKAGAITALRQSAGILAESGDALAHARTLARIGAILEQAGDLPAAREHYRQALALSPDDPGVLQSFAVLAEAQHDDADALDAYQRLARAPSAAQEAKRSAQAKLLGLYVQLEDLAGARRALAERGSEPDAETLTRLAALEEAAGELVAAAQLLGRATVQTQGLRRAQLELERARLFGIADERVEERSSLVHAHELDPEGAVGEQAARALAVLARAGDDPAAEARWLDDLIGRKPPDFDELAVRRAQLSAAAGDPTAARGLLERVGEAVRARPEVQQLWADLLGALGDRAGRAATLEVLAAAASGEQRATLLVSAAESRLAADDVDGAHRAALAAEQLAPADPRVRVVIAEVAFRRKSWEEVVTLYDELFTESTGPERVEYGRRLGIALERLGRPTEALAAFRRAVEIEGASGAPLGLAWRACAEAHQRGGDYLNTAQALRGAALDPRTGDEPAARAELLRRAAELLHRRAGAHAEAVALLEDALRVDPEALLTLDALEALQSELGDTAALERTLERKLVIASATREQRLEWLASLAELAGRRDKQAARRHHARILELEPRNETSLRFLAAEAWERGDLAASARYFATLLTRPDLPRDDARAIRLRLAELAEGGDDPGEAEVHLWAAVELTPVKEQPALLRRLEDIYLRGERWSDVAVVLLQQEALADAPARLALELRRIEITLRRLRTPDDALEAIRGALQRHPDDPRLLELWVEAARAAGTQDELATALMQLARHASGGRAPLIAELSRLNAGGLAVATTDVALIAATLHEQLSELAAHGAPPDDDASLLLDLLRRLGQDNDARRSLADALVAAAALPVASAQAAAWLIEAADIRRGRLDDFAGAAEALTQAAVLAPTPATLQDLETLLTDLGDWPRLAALHEQQLAAAHGDARLVLLDKLARVGEASGDEAAAERWRGQLRLEDTHTPQVSVATLVRTIAPAAEAAGADASALRRAVEAEERKLASLPADEVLLIRRARMKLGQLYAQVNRLADSYRQLSAVISEEPSNRPALEMLVAVAEKQGAWLEAAQAWEQLAHLYDESKARAEALYRQGELRLVKLGQRDEAADAFLKAIDLEPDHAPTVRRLIDYFWSIDDRTSVVEMAAALDEKAFVAKETTVGTRARAALATALSGDRRAAMRLGALLGSGGPLGLARAVADAARRSASARALIDSVKAVCAGAPQLLAETRGALEKLAAEDQRLSALVTQL